jgi:D-3-phosphoglycerate dehydrogenase / 2-oxoglutarate reductase
MKKVLIVQPIRPEALQLFEQRSDIVVEVLTDISPENIRRHIVDADALTVRDAPVPIHALEVAPRLKVISRHGVGFDNIPVDYCTARGIAVTIVGDVNAVSVAEHTMFLMLCAARGGIMLDKAVRHGDFSARTRIIGLELRGRTLLVVGFGRVGREVATRAIAFGMSVLVFDPFADRACCSTVSYVATLDEGLVRADVVSLHLPLTTETRNLIGQRELALLPIGAIIVNTARGGIIDESAMVAALKNGRLHGAGVDTFTDEPLFAGHPILTEERTVLSPHAAALTVEALVAMSLATARNAIAGLDGSLDHTLVVNPAVLKKTSNALQ